MATLVMSAAGAAFGGSLGGSMLGMTTLAIGKAAGAALGSMVDQHILGAGSAPSESGRVDRLRVMSSSEGTVLPRCFGRVRLPGQLIWSSRFTENVAKQNSGGKGGRSGRTVSQYSYSISLCMALCEGEVYRIGRIWADGQPLDQSTLTWRLHKGTEDQQPDPVIAAIEGENQAPAYRGTAYVVIEDLDLTPFGNRIPQFNFEVFRRPKIEHEQSSRPPALDIRAVALIPGTGEYALATEPVVVAKGRGELVIVNVHNDRGVPDVIASMDQLDAELPQCEAVSMVVSWFGNDLRINHCSIYPAVEQKGADGREIPWRVSDVTRDNAKVVQRRENRPIFGGTPADAAVVQAIRHMTASSKAVMFYPFILMDIVEGNGTSDPWSPESEQPAVPWRGRLTLSRAPGVMGSPDKSAAAAAEVKTFFGTAEPSHFRVTNEHVTYSGPQEWSYRRFILHYAALCAAAGGVDAFCIGTEMRSLTQIRDGVDSYPAVRELRDLAQDVRLLLGRKVKLSYAADWSEYFGHQPTDGSGDVLFHLDELWADEAIDFIGIDNYMPLSDWRDGSDHLDVNHGTIYNVDYLRANVAGGEGYDWYYPDAKSRGLQERCRIQDGAYSEHWVFRYKDIRSWWSNAHFNRIGGSRKGEPTPWVPFSKPIWFTEFGCPAVDKGTNQPHVFHDPKSSESLNPYFSNGSPDDQVLSSYLEAIISFWSDLDNNPTSPVYHGRMLDLSRCFVWAWDSRPWPDFPFRSETWTDAPNYSLGHWLNGRIGKPRIADIITEVCSRANVKNIDTTASHGLANGYIIGSTESARQSLQPLLLAYSIDVNAEGNRLSVCGRGAGLPVELALGRLAIESETARLDRTRSAPAESPVSICFSFIRADQEYQVGAVEATLPNTSEQGTSETSLQLVLNQAEAQLIVERWLHEARIAQEMLTFSAAPSTMPLGAGDTIILQGSSGKDIYRVDRVVERGLREITAVKIAGALYQRLQATELTQHRSVAAQSPVHVELLNLPLLRGDEEPHAPHIAILKRPWQGPVAVYSSFEDADYRLVCTVDRPTVMGTLLTPLPAAVPALWMRQAVKVYLDWGTLSSRSELEVLAGSNIAALRLNSSGHAEIIQFSDARMVAPRTFEIRNLLRGQAGTDFCIPSEWPVGTDFFLLDAELCQLNLPAWSRGLDLHLRVGPASMPLNETTSSSLKGQAVGVGLRPYSPVHLKAKRQINGSLDITWIRRTRIDGDSWDSTDVPIGEEAMLFHLRMFFGDRLLRMEAVTEQSFLYTSAAQREDDAAFPLIIEVTQVSARFGEGPSSRIILDE